MFWSWGYYAKWSKSDRERQILYDLLYVELKTNKKTKTKKTKLIETEKRLVAVRGQGGRNSELFFFLFLVYIDWIKSF